MKTSILALAVAILLSLSFAVPSPGSYATTPVTYTALFADYYRVATTPGDVACGATVSQDWLYQGAKLIEIKSCQAIFGGPGDVMSGDYTFDKVLFDPIGLTGSGSSSLNGTYYQSANPSQWVPRVFYKVPGRDCYNWNYLTYDPSSAYYDAIGIASASYNNNSRIWFSKMQLIGFPPGTSRIMLSEFAGPATYPSGDAWVESAVPFIANAPSYLTLRFKDDSSSVSVVYYFGTTSEMFSSYELPFITERGTKFASIGNTEVSFQLSRVIAKPAFAFYANQLSSASATPAYFSTLITDTVDRTLQNRMYNTTLDVYPALLSDPDTNSTTSPLRGALGGTYKAKALYMLDGNSVPAFFPYQIIDNTAWLTYSGAQSFWAGTTQNGVAYDPSSAVRDVDVNKYGAIVYSLKLKGNDYGIPACTGGLAVPGDWASCYPNATLSRTDRHRVNIYYLGSGWVISEMTPPSSPLPSGVSAINGGLVKIGKEQQYAILSINQSLNASPLGIKLKNVMAPSAICNGESPAVFDIIGKTGIVGQAQVCPGPTYTFTQAGTSLSVKIHVYRTNYSPAAYARWAETAIYSQEIILQDGMRYNLVPSTSIDKDFRVSLLWKNRDYVSGGSTQPDSLREMVIYNIDGFAQKTLPGQSVTLLASTPVYNLKYLGITQAPTCALSPQPPSACNDSDGGNNPYQLGTCHDYHGTFNDYCDNAGLEEVSCQISTQTGLLECIYDVVPCASGYVCSNGACIYGANNTCTDTDGSLNGYVYGSTYNATTYMNDTCVLNNTHVLEGYCSGSQVLSSNTYCMYGCSAGQCNIQTNTTNQTGSLVAIPVPSYGGTVSGTAYNFPVPATRLISALPSPGYAFSNWVVTYGDCIVNYPENANTTISIYSGTCEVTAYFNSTGGNQTNNTCTDTDGGINAFVWGTTYNATVAKNDTCFLNNTYVLEWYCSNANVYSYDYYCQYGCSNGKCNNQTNTTNQTGSLVVTPVPSYGGTASGTAYNFVVPAYKFVSASPAYGYNFAGWSVAGNCNATNPPSPNTTVYVASGTCYAYAQFQGSNVTAPQPAATEKTKPALPSASTASSGTSPGSVTIERGSSPPDEMGPAPNEEALEISNSMADTTGDMYAKMMNILGVYIKSFKK